MEGASKVTNLQQATEAYKSHYDTYFKKVDEMHKNTLQWDIDYKETAKKVDDWRLENKHISYASYPSKDEVTADFRAKVALREEYRAIRDDLKRIGQIFQQAAKESDTSPGFAIQKVEIDTLSTLAEKYFVELKVPLEKLGKIESGYYVNAGLSSMLWNALSSTFGYTHVHAAKMALAQPPAEEPGASLDPPPAVAKADEMKTEEKKEDAAVSAPVLTIEQSAGAKPAVVQPPTKQTAKSSPQQNSPSFKPRKEAPHAPALKIEEPKGEFPALPTREKGILSLLGTLFSSDLSAPPALQPKPSYAEVTRAPSPQNTKMKKA